MPLIQTANFIASIPFAVFNTCLRRDNKSPEVLLSREREALEKTELKFIFPAHANTSQMLVLSSHFITFHYLR